MSAWFVYLAICSDGTLYAGVTTDPVRRQHEHNSSNKGARYTRSRQPVTLHVVAQLATRSEALEEEHRIRKLGREAKLKMLQSIGPPELYCNDDH
jgi:putative endonuclease